MTRHSLIQLNVLLLVLASLGNELRAEEPTQLPREITALRFGEESVSRWTFGVKITATASSFKNLFATIPVPQEWPEQKVDLVEQDTVPEELDVTYRVLQKSVKHLLVKKDELAEGESLRAIVTMKVTRREMLPPEHTAEFVVPPKVSEELQPYLLPSPYIESDHPDLVRQAKQIWSEKETNTDWKRTEGLYDWVYDRIEFVAGPMKGALAGFHDKSGDSEEITSLFIAFCRANGIPSRAVWCDQVCYPEFYLVDASGSGAWFPCGGGPIRRFGGSTYLGPILQKGDSILVPEKKEPQRYASEFLSGKSPSRKPPTFEFIRRIDP